jgi:hypothetical protein
MIASLHVVETQGRKGEHGPRRYPPRFQFTASVLPAENLRNTRRRRKHSNAFPMKILTGNRTCRLRQDLSAIFRAGRGTLSSFLCRSPATMTLSRRNRVLENTKMAFDSLCSQDQAGWSESPERADRSNSVRCRSTRWPNCSVAGRGRRAKPQEAAMNRLFALTALSLFWAWNILPI